MQFRSTVSHFQGVLLRVLPGHQDRREAQNRARLRPPAPAKEESPGNLKFFIRELIMAYKDLLLYMQSMHST